MGDEDGEITQRMLETILHEMDARFDTLDQKIETFRVEIVAELRGIKREIAVLNKDGLKIRADQEQLFERVEELESKAS